MRHLFMSRSEEVVSGHRTQYAEHQLLLGCRKKQPWNEVDFNSEEKSST